MQTIFQPVKQDFPFAYGCYEAYIKNKIALTMDFHMDTRMIIRFLPNKRP